VKRANQRANLRGRDGPTLEVSQDCDASNDRCWYVLGRILGDSSRCSHRCVRGHPPRPWSTGRASPAISPIHASSNVIVVIRFGGHLLKGGHDVHSDGRDLQGPAPRRRFDDDFKAQAVRLVLDEGKSVGAVARDLDLTETALREWVKRARADRTKGRTALTTAEREELARLRKENRALRTEREIPKKAAAFFAKHQS
jgi:transposase